MNKKSWQAVAYDLTHACIKKDLQIETLKAERKLGAIDQDRLEWMLSFEARCYLDPKDPRFFIIEWHNHGKVCRIWDLSPFNALDLAIRETRK